MRLSAGNEISCGSRRGLSYVVVLIFVALLALLLFHMMAFMQQEIHLSTVIQRHAMLTECAESGIEYAKVALERMRLDPGRFWPGLVGDFDPARMEPQGTRSLTLYPGGPDPWPGIDALLAECAPQAVDLRVIVEVGPFRAFDNPYLDDAGDYGMGPDDFDNACTGNERRAVMTITARAASPPLERVVRECREFKIVCVAPPVVSHMGC